MKRVPSYWWDFVWFRNSEGVEDFKIVVESDRDKGAELIPANSIDHALRIIDDLKAGRMQWPKG